MMFGRKKKTATADEATEQGSTTTAPDAVTSSDAAETPARGPRGPDCSTTNAGRSRDSLPRPYVTQAPRAGRPGALKPAFMNSFAGP